MTERRIAECTTSEELVRTLCDLIRFHAVHDEGMGRALELFEFKQHVMGLVEDAENEIDGILAEEARLKALQG